MDNQLHQESLLPVVLFAEQAAPGPPVIRMSIVRAVGGVGVDLWKLFEVDIQPLVLRLDERVLLELLRFLAACTPAPETAHALGVGEDDGVESLLSIRPATYIVHGREAVSQFIFFEVKSSLKGINLHACVHI